MFGPRQTLLKIKQKKLKMFREWLSHCWKFFSVTMTSPTSQHFIEILPATAVREQLGRPGWDIGCLWQRYWGQCSVDMDQRWCRSAGDDGDSSIFIILQLRLTEAGTFKLVYVNCQFWLTQWHILHSLELLVWLILSVNSLHADELTLFLFLSFIALTINITLNSE